MRGRRRRRRDRVAFLTAVALIAAVGVTTTLILTGHRAPISFSLVRGATQAPKAAPVDGFGFSGYWLATHGQPELPIHGRAALLVDLDAKQVLWQRDPETPRAPASLTKLMTAMVAVDDAGSLDREVTVTKEATQVVPTVMGLTPGERLTVRELLAGLLLGSGNDAAEALAQGIVPRDRFIRQMNLKARAIGLTASHFVNPSGLDADGHVMSAQDLVHEAAYLEANYPQVAAIAATRDIAIAATADHKAFYPHNLNRMLWTYPGATGLKTGLTDNAGGCWLATASRGGRHLIVVVLNATGQSATDAATLLDYGFSVHPQRGFGPWASSPS
ncbi:MAG TPA: serine hydrolase [Candidatus Dormibacteraeota bacterium]|nr:serine hydrolase [Candidatus Dormibacteraeota bacterium]